MSTYVIPVLDAGPSAYMITPIAVFNIVETAETVQEAIAALWNAVEQFPFKRIMFVCKFGYEYRRTCIEALKKASFTDIETIDPLSIIISEAIYDLPLNCDVGDLVLVCYNPKKIQLNEKITIIEKCKKGWKIINLFGDLFDGFYQHPSVKHIVSFKKNYSKLQDFLTLHSDIRVHYSINNDLQFKTMFIRNRFNKGNLGGYEVLPYFGYDLGLSYGHDSAILKLAQAVPPVSLSCELNVANIDSVRSFCISQREQNPIVKSFKFTNEAYRTVIIKVDVDATLLPQVSLKTASTYDPPDKTASVFFTVQLNNKYLLDAYYANHHTTEGSFDLAKDLIAYISKFPSSKILGICFIESSMVPPEIIRNFQVECQRGINLKATVISEASLKLLFTLFFVNVSINTDEKVCIISGKTYFIVGRDDKFLKVIQRTEMPDLPTKLAEVNAIVIDNVVRQFTKADLTYFQSKFTGLPVHITPEVTLLNPYYNKYIWSLTDKTKTDKNILNNVCDFEFAIEENGQIFQSINTRFKQMPYVATVSHVVRNSTKISILSDKNNIEMETIADFTVKPSQVVEFTITVMSASDVTVDMKPRSISAHRKSSLKIVELPLPDKSQQIISKIDEKVEKPKKKKKAAKVKSVDTVVSTDAKTNSPASAILTFTSDNRVLIQVDKTYTGVKEVLAYVRLQNDKQPETGLVPYKAWKKQQLDSVFYDIARLLAVDFDPDHPDPAWKFETARSADGQVIVSGGNVTTFPLVLFGIVIRSTVLYIQDHIDNHLTSIKIKLPKKSTISDVELEKVAKKIGVELSLLD